MYYLLNVIIVYYSIYVAMINTHGFDVISLLLYLPITVTGKVATDITHAYNIYIYLYIIIIIV